MKINILTLFPEMFSGFKSESIIGRAVEKGSLEINVIDISKCADCNGTHSLPVGS